jgi:PIN domain nuclease of toxin-antitoxin system
MDFLVDTHILLWSAIQSPRLSAEAEMHLESPQNTLWFSVLSLWEVAFKRSKLRDDFVFEVNPLRTGLLTNGYFELNIDARHIAAVVDLPAYHTDPFDRLLVAQAKAEGMILLTSDSQLAQYGDMVRTV